MTKSHSWGRRWVMPWELFVQLIKKTPFREHCTTTTGRRAKCYCHVYRKKNKIKIKKKYKTIVNHFPKIHPINCMLIKEKRRRRSSFFFHNLQTMPIKMPSWKMKQQHWMGERVRRLMCRMNLDMDTTNELNFRTHLKIIHVRRRSSFSLLFISPFLLDFNRDFRRIVDELEEILLACCCSSFESWKKRVEQFCDFFCYSLSIITAVAAIRIVTLTLFRRRISMKNESSSVDNYILN